MVVFGSEPAIIAKGPKMAKMYRILSPSTQRMSAQ